MDIENSKGLRVIKTARDKEAINSYAKLGFFPFVLKVTPSHQINEDFTVMQNMNTGEIAVFYDGHDAVWFEDLELYDEVIPWTNQYPHKFDSPFAAYIIPKDLKVGDYVFLEDLIEDFIGSVFNNNTYRLKSCEAIWTGNGFDIQYDPELHVRRIRT